MRRIIADGFGFLISVALLIASLAIQFLIIFANYTALKSAFELMGFEPRPLGEDITLGAFFSAIGLANATLADIYAAPLAALMGVGFYYAFDYSVKAGRLYLDRRDYLRDGKEENARQALNAIIRCLFILLLLAIPLYCVAQWDWSIFKFRLEGNLTNTQVPEEILKWSPDEVTRLGEYASWFLGRNALGYIGATVLACLLIEVAKVQMSEKYEVLCDAIDTLFNGDESDQSEQTVQEVTEDQTPIVTDASSGDHGAPAFADARETLPAAVDAPLYGQSVIDDETTLVIPRPKPASAATAHMHTPTEGSPEMVEVFTREGVERITREEANIRADLVSDSTGRSFWQRDYYEEVHGNEPARAA